MEIYSLNYEKSSCIMNNRTLCINLKTCDLICIYIKKYMIDTCLVLEYERRKDE